MATRSQSAGPGFKGVYLVGSSYFLPSPSLRLRPQAYPHPRQRPVTLRSNLNPRRKHICRGERVLGIEELPRFPPKPLRTRR